MIQCLLCDATAAVTITTDGPRPGVLAHYPACAQHIEAIAQRVRGDQRRLPPSPPAPARPAQLGTPHHDVIDADPD